MKIETAINELTSIQALFETGAARCLRLRKQLEQFSAPAPSGVSKKSEAKIIGMINKRNTRIYKRAGK
jgi:hypothetical protein